MLTKVCEGGAGLPPMGGAEGGAKVAVREGISRGSQPKDRESLVSPRYDAKGLGIQGLSPFSRAIRFRLIVANVRQARAGRDLPGRSGTGTTGSAPQGWPGHDLPRRRDVRLRRWSGAAVGRGADTHCRRRNYARAQDEIAFLREIVASRRVA